GRRRVLGRLRADRGRGALAAAGPGPAVHAAVRLGPRRGAAPAVAGRPPRPPAGPAARRVARPRRTRRDPADLPRRPEGGAEPDRTRGAGRQAPGGLVRVTTQIPIRP